MVQQLHAVYLNKSQPIKIIPSLIFKPFNLSETWAVYNKAK